MIVGPTKEQVSSGWHFSASSDTIILTLVKAAAMQPARILMYLNAVFLQVEKVDVLLSQWRGRIAILLNAEWTVETVDSKYSAFVKSFDSIYSFLPLAIQVHFCLLA